MIVGDWRDGRPDDELWRFSVDKGAPEAELAKIFSKIGADYGGDLPGAIEKRTANRQRARAWYWANRERVWARVAKWKREHPERWRQLMREGAARHRAKRKAAAAQCERELEDA